MIHLLESVESLLNSIKDSDTDYSDPAKDET